MWLNDLKFSLRLGKLINSQSLVYQTNKISDWLEIPDPNKNPIEVAKLSCEMLATVRGNEQFHRGLKDLARGREKDKKEFLEILHNVEKLEDFLEQEMKLLIKYGVSNAEKYIEEGREALKRVKLGEKYASGPVMASIDDLRKEACKLSNRLEAEKQEQRKQTLKKIVVGVGGVVVATINVQAAQELGPTTATLSGHMGAAIIGAAAGEVWSLLDSS